MCQSEGYSRGMGVETGTPGPNCDGAARFARPCLRGAPRAPESHYSREDPAGQSPAAQISLEPDEEKRAALFRLRPDPTFRNDPVPDATHDTGIARAVGKYPRSG
jgi:hypothetical protein